MEVVVSGGGCELRWVEILREQHCIMVCLEGHQQFPSPIT